MSTPSKDLLEVEGALRIVIESLVDGQEGFQGIGESLKNAELKLFFLAESLKRAQFRGDLESILHQEGVKDIKETGSAAGAFVRLWGDLKAKLGGSNESLLETAEEAEHKTLEAYAVALEKFLPEPIREVLSQQAVHISASHEFIRVARAAGTLEA
jgi:uncharacterized protein (TIGR02284 family)